MICYTILMKSKSHHMTREKYDATASPCPTSQWKESGFLELLLLPQIIYIKTQTSASSLSLAALPRDWQCINLPSTAANIIYSSSLSLPSQPWYTNSYFNVECLTAPVWPFAPYNGPKPFLPPPHPFLSFHFFHVPHLCLLLVFQLLSPLCLLLLTLPWHEGRSSVKLPSSPPDVVSAGNNYVWPCADCLH